MRKMTLKLKVKAHEDAPVMNRTWFVTYDEKSAEDTALLEEAARRNLAVALQDRHRRKIAGGKETPGVPDGLPDGYTVSLSDLVNKREPSDPKASATKLLERMDEKERAAWLEEQLAALRKAKK